MKTFGTNPGRLRMRLHVPATLESRPAMLVALHGCSQTAAGYDQGSGWSKLADRHGFLLLLPEQSEIGNRNRCFNWFLPEHVQRDQGEALSIRQMVEHAAIAHGVDPKRIFVTGLSAGGAMTAALCATYPDVFAGGAIIAGLPYGSASSLPEALEAMARGRERLPADWGKLVQSASRHKGTFPRMSIWHGTADPVVSSTNAQASIVQWLAVHGLDARNHIEEPAGDKHRRRVWRDADGNAVVEAYSVEKLGHAVPLALGGREPVGEAGAFQHDVGLASPQRIAAYFGLAPMPDEERRGATAAAMAGSGLESQLGAVPQAVESVITHALKQAGLLGADGKPIGASGAAGKASEVVADALRAAGLIKRS